MLKTFPIDFIRQALEQTLYEEHFNNPYFFGGKNQVNILSFYEQLKEEGELDRFVETYRDLTEQQNRTGLILNGVLVSPENPSITNLYSALIVPMSFTCSLRCTLANRDQAIETINNMIDCLKGSKVDIAQLNCVDENGKRYAQPFVVGTIGHNKGKPEIKNGDFVGAANSVADIRDVLLSNLSDKGIEIDYKKLNYLYCENNSVLKVCSISKSGTLPYVGINDDATLVDSKTIEVSGSAGFRLNESSIYEIECDVLIYDEDNNYETVKSYGEIFDIEYDTPTHTNFKVRFKLENDIQSYVENYSYFELSSVKFYGVSFNFIEDDGTYSDIIFPPENISFEKYKLSFSFDAIRCDEPRTLNGEDYCELSFGGSATLVNNGVKLGNDLIKISLSKKRIVAATNINFEENIEYLEPLEMPSGNNANTQINQLVSKQFKVNSHTDAIALTLQYTFIADDNIPLLKQIFDYSRYGTQGITVDDISPNIIFETTEYWSSWGNYEPKVFLAKMVENNEIENTESDVLTLSLTMQIQGENN